MRFVIDETIQNRLLEKPRTWLITGVAGFIGSHLLEVLLNLNQRVRGLDNFSTGFQRNLDEVKAKVSPGKWNNFYMLRADIHNFDICQEACAGCDYILHQAALTSVPGSIVQPLETAECNLTGMINLLQAARLAGVKRFVYATTSAVYGNDHRRLKQERYAGTALSPYALSKYTGELWAQMYSHLYKVPTVGLRYFNVFGPRQDPHGGYAAVIPKWFSALLSGELAYIYGDGKASRDFCYIDNVVQANLLAACSESPAIIGEVFNVGLSQRTTLNQLFHLIRQQVSLVRPDAAFSQPVYTECRIGDIRQSVASIKKICGLLGYQPSVSLATGLALTLDWYVEQTKKQAA